ncbi:hypothetical protein L7F22_049010 [Adiantum nelumboides]|nr:hypothetical protein [Adiantum nelumboides]
MAVSFPTFYGHHDENARDFMDSLEMAHLMAGRDQEEVKLRAFPLVLKGKARVWYDALAPPSKATWPTLYGAFLNKCDQGDIPENLWKQPLRHRQGSLGDYNTYESKFTNLWERWAASLQGQGGAPNFLKRDKFVEGMFPTLKEKVEAKFPQTFEEAQEIATVKFKKLLYQERKSNCVKEREEGVPHFKLVHFFYQGSTISWVPCGKKLTCSYPDIRFFYGVDTYYNNEVTVLEIDGQFDKLEELVYVEIHLSNI